MIRLKVARCRSCQAEIIWAKTPTGKNIPLNADPVNGVVEVVSGDDGPRARLIHEARLSHFATCPHADSWRMKA